MTQYPENGLYDVFITYDRSGQTTTERANSTPKTWEDACRWSARLMAMVGQDVSGFGSVADVQIVRVNADDYQFITDRARDNWLLDMAQNIITARRAQADAGRRALMRHLSGQPGHAKEITAIVCGAEVTCHFSDREVVSGLAPVTCRWERQAFAGVLA